jgi:DNA polymerase-3 subunit delta'
MNQLIGHDRQLEAFKAALASGKTHHGWLFAGPKGVGKGLFAQLAASFLVDPDGQHRNMAEQRTHPDILWIERLPKEPPKEGDEPDPDAEKKRSISIEQIRELQQKLTKRATLGERRVIIIDAADDLERGGANALLKSLEEPPAGTYFFLISHASERLLPTIRSRCRMLRFAPLSDGNMRNALAQLFEDIGGPAVDAILAASNGAPGQALRIFGLDMGDLEQKMDRILQTGDVDNQIRSQLAESLSLKSGQQRYEAFLRRIPVRIAQHARTLSPTVIAPAIEAFHASDILANRALALSLDKQAVIFEMGSLLASLQTHKHGASSR